MRLGCTPYSHVIGLTRFAGLADHSRLRLCQPTKLATHVVIALSASVECSPDIGARTRTCGTCVWQRQYLHIRQQHGARGTDQDFTG